MRIAKIAAFLAVFAVVCSARATVTGNPPPAVYSCNGSATVFTIPFAYLAPSDLVVSTKTTAGISTVLTIGTNYSVRPSVAPSTGTLTLTTACASGSSLTIARAVALRQPQSFQSGSYKGAVHEQAFDRLAMELQDTVTAQAAKDATQDAALSQGAVGGNATLVTPSGGSNAVSLATMFGDLRNVRGFGAAGDGITDDRAAFALANAATGQRWIPTGTYRIASSITLGGVWRFAPGATLKPTSGNTVTFDTTAIIYSTAAPVDTSAGGLVTFQAGATKLATQIGPTSKTSNIVNGYAGNQIATDVGISIINGGGNVGSENYIGYSESLDRQTGNGATTTWTTSYDASPSQIALILVRADGVRVTGVESNATLTQSGTKVQVVYPRVGHFVNDATGGAEGTNAALLSTEKLYISSNVKTAVVGSGSDYSSILDGYDNVITCGIRQTASGAHHRITNCSGNHNSIFGGSYDRISGTGTYVFIAGGSGNEDAAGGSGTFIAGFGNTTAGTGPGTAIGSTNSTNGAFSVAIGGSNQSNANGAVVVGRTNTSSGQDSFVSGTTNTVTAPFSTTGGFTNSNTNATGYSAVWGRQNTVSAAYTGVTGQLNTASADWTRVSGKNANAALPFCSVIGGEQIAANGDTQTSTCTAHRQTTNATGTEIRFGAATSRITIASNTTWTFSILVTARQVSGTVSAGWRVEGVLANDAGTVRLVGTPTVTSLGADAGAAAWTVAASADNTNKALSLTATGAAATTINWTARIQLAEVSG